MELTTCTSLADCFALNDFLRHSAGAYPALYTWEPRRWEGLLFYNSHAELIKTRQQVAQEVVIARESGEVVGAVIPEYPGGAFLQSAPGNETVQRALLQWAQANLTQTNAEGSWLEVWCQDGDELRTGLLTEAGFKPTSEHQFCRTRNSNEEALGPELDGYEIRSIRPGDTSDLENISTLLNAAFNRDIHNAEEYENFSALAPSFESDLQIVAVAPDGTFAAHAGFTIHRTEGYGVVEPVCTHPDHQNRGLARAAMAEGINRCRAAGVNRLHVGAWYSNPVSNHVYASMGFLNPVADRIWRWDEVND